MPFSRAASACRRTSSRRTRRGRIVRGAFSGRRFSHRGPIRPGGVRRRAGRRGAGRGRRPPPPRARGADPVRRHPRRRPAPRGTARAGSYAVANTANSAGTPSPLRHFGTPVPDAASRRARPVSTCRRRCSSADSAAGYATASSREATRVTARTRRCRAWTRRTRPRRASPTPAAARPHRRSGRRPDRIGDTGGQVAGDGRRPPRPRLTVGGRGEGAAGRSRRAGAGGVAVEERVGGGDRAEQPLRPTSRVWAAEFGGGGGGEHGSEVGAGAGRHGGGVGIAGTRGKRAGRSHSPAGPVATTPRRDGTRGLTEWHSRHGLFVAITIWLR